MDWALVNFLLERLILYDAVRNCVRLGRVEDRNDLPMQEVDPHGPAFL